jgi:hypothetical protein
MISLVVNRRKLSIALGAVFVVLLVAHLVAVLLRYKFMPESSLAEKWDHFFNMDQEANFPTYFNTILLFMVAQTFFLMGKSKEGNNDFYFRTYWYFLSVIFVFLSIDELASIHEWFIDLIPHVFGIGGTGIFKFAWIVPYGIFVIALGFYSITFLLSLKKEYQVKYLIAGAVYISGAVIVEAFGGIVFEQNKGIPTFDYILFFVTPEETMEMLPLIYIINLNLKYLSDSEADL